MQSPENETLEQTLVQTCSSEFAYCLFGNIIGASLKVVERIPLRSRGGGWNPRVQRCLSLWITSCVSKLSSASIVIQLHFHLNRCWPVWLGFQSMQKCRLDQQLKWSYFHTWTFYDFVRLDLFESDFRLALFPLITLGVPGPSVVLLWFDHCKFGCLYRCGFEIALARLGFD